MQSGFETEPAGLLSLDAPTTLRVCDHLSASEVAALRCTCLRLSRVLTDEQLWAALARRDWALPECSGPAGTQPVASWCAAYSLWATTFSCFSLARARTAAQLAHRLRGWAKLRLPQLSLQAPASKEAVDSLSVLGPAEDCRLLWRVLAAGQNPGTSPLGLLGSYAVYDHRVSLRLLRLDEVLAHTRECRARLLPAGSTAVLLAASPGKLLFVDSAGDVFVLDRSRRLVAVSPPGVGLLGWLAEYVRRLEEGVYVSAPANPGLPASLGISLFPRAAPRMSSATTFGVRVDTSALFMVEQSDERRDAFAYSVAFRLLPIAEQGADPLQRVQLAARHWVIVDHAGKQNEVRGEGVIGDFPILEAGAAPFVYQSQTLLPHGRGRGGRMYGDFTFVRGTFDSPAGAEFEAVCAPFDLTVEAYVY
jgi:uncharacterized protein affecting Mg2+/Co2+ transport